MIGKFIFRFFAICFALFLMIVAGIGLCFWLAFQEPSAYAELRSQKFTDQQRQSVEQRIEESMTSVEDWIRESVRQNATQRLLHQNEPLTEDVQSTAQNPAALKSFVLSQDELNTMLSGTRFNVGDVKNIRAQILDNLIRLSAEIVMSQQTSLVVSTDLRLTTTEADELKLEVLGGSIGRLPVPLKLLLTNLPEGALPQDDKVEFRLTDSVPHMLIQMVDSDSNPKLKQIRTEQGKIELNFGAPVVAF